MGVYAFFCYGPIELYRLDQDLGEQKNLAAEHPEIVAQLKALMSEAVDK